MARPKTIFSIKLILTVVLLNFYVSAYSQNTNLVSNVDGKIRVIILHYGNGAYFDGFWFDMSVLVRDLLKKMDPDVAFVILHGKDGNAKKFKQALQPFNRQKLCDGTKRIKYHGVNVKTSDFYPWARDAYFIQKEPKGGLAFLDTGFNFKPFPITDFNKIFKHAVVRAGIFHRGGGNVRTTGEEIFIGIDTILGKDMTPQWSSYGHIQETLYSVAEQYLAGDTGDLKKIFNAYASFLHHNLAPDRRLIVPGKALFFDNLEMDNFHFTKKTVHDTGAQAAYHTDVYMSLGHVNSDGKRILFIADSGLGAQVLSRISSVRRREIEERLPTLLEQEGFTAVGILVSSQQIARRFQWRKHKLLDLAMEKAKESEHILNDAAADLKNQGFHIIRIPYLPNGLNNDDDKNDQVMGISFNYSNVLTEVYNNVKRVYIPRYGFKELDEAAFAAYESAGYEVEFIGGLLTNALTSRRDGKGLDCLTSEIRFPVQWSGK